MQFSDADYHARIAKHAEEEKEVEEIVTFTRASRKPNL